MNKLSVEVVLLLGTVKIWFCEWNNNRIKEKNLNLAWVRFLVGARLEVALRLNTHNRNFTTFAKIKYRREFSFPALRIYPIR
jgi:hypothetical protein